MKLILSRKGFGSAAGGCPSPLIDGHPLSLPIPTCQPSPTRYGDIANGLAQIVTDLTKGRLTADHCCHLDPDLDGPVTLRTDRANSVEYADGFIACPETLSGRASEGERK